MVCGLFKVSTKALDHRLPDFRFLVQRRPDNFQSLLNFLSGAGTADTNPYAMGSRIPTGGKGGRWFDCWSGGVDNLNAGDVDEFFICW